MHTPAQATVNYSGKNGAKVRAMLRARFAQPDLAGIDPGTRDMVIAEYVRTGHYRIYARGGRPRAKVPQAAGDLGRMAVAQYERDRKGAARKQREVGRVVGKTKAAMAVHLRTMFAMRWTMTRLERECAYALGIFR
jgi:hypothetical protein